MIPNVNGQIRYVSLFWGANGPFLETQNFISLWILNFESILYLMLYYSKTTCYAKLSIC